MAQKKHVVAKAFTDANGKAWQPGQQYTGDDAAEQVRQGNVKEE